MTKKMNVRDDNNVKQFIIKKRTILIQNDSNFTTIQSA